ncbi:hypothetical protein ACVIGB_000772 [Bradyrhizobium sp. USDA 4341]
MITGLVDIDALPSETKEDIGHILAERHPFFVGQGLDYSAVRDNLFGLAEAPKVRVIMAKIGPRYRGMDRGNSSAAVDKYAAMLRADPEFEFDPILVSGGDFLDGGHRLEAYARAARAQIPAVEIGHLMAASKQDWEAWFDGSTDPSNPIYGNGLAESEISVPLP